MTEHTNTLVWTRSPECPDWCRGHAPTMWEDLDENGHARRWHESAVVFVDAFEPGTPEAPTVVGVKVAREEIAGDGVDARPTAVSVDGAWLTGYNARALASQLVAHAEVAEGASARTHLAAS